MWPSGIAVTGIVILKTVASGLSIAVLALTCAAPFAHATDITVTRTSDIVDRDDGLISLREAVEAINGQAAYSDAPAGDGNYDTIYLPLRSNPYHLSDRLEIRRSMYIVGTGSSHPTIDRQSNENFLVIPSHILVIHAPQPGEFLLVGIQNVKLSNSKDSAIFVYDGASLNMYRCDVTNTIALGDPGAALWNRGYCDLDTCTLDNNNDSPRGGAIYNTASGYIHIRNSTLSNNRAGIGGGILNHGRLTLKNCTISGNKSRSQGAGIYNGPSGVTEVFACTITNNGNEGGEGGGGINNNTGGYVYMWNTILAKNRSTSAGPDCYGRITSFRYNIVGTNRDATVTDYVWGDMTPWDDIGDKPLPNGVITPEIDPMLKPLGNQDGGYTRTHALQPGSPAIDRGGSTSGFPLASWDPLDTDQRNTIRPRDGDNDGQAVADIGAYEY